MNGEGDLTMLENCLNPDSRPKEFYLSALVISFRPGRCPTLSAEILV